jgi:hypothetical protein
MTSTKARHQEFLAVATKLIELAGGLEALDSLSKDEHKVAFNRLVDNLLVKTGCSSRQIARRIVATAMRRGRDYLVEMRNHGGARKPGPGKTLGPAPLPPEQKRRQVSTRLASDVIDNNGEVEGSKELAQAIAEVFELDGWGRAVDEALVRMVENDPELRGKLAKMGIVLLGRG